MWGVFENGESIHVIPIAEDKKSKEPHIIDEFCCCNPKVKQGENGFLIVVHNEPN